MMFNILRRKRQQATRANQIADLIGLRARDMRKLKQQDYVNAGFAVGVAPAILAAFAEVESSGRGFEADGRITICYEPHVASRNTSPKHGYVKPYPDLFSTSWRSEANKASYRSSQLDRWDKVARAAQIDFNAAISGTSWGAFQILGENAKTLGFGDAWEMITYMNTGPGAHLDCCIRFLRRNGLIEPLQQGDWRTVAARYNGSANVDDYSQKMAAAFERKLRVFA